MVNLNNERPQSIGVKEVSLSYQGKVALWNINAELPLAQLIGIVGPNGAGKSTLLKVLAGLIKPDKGIVCLPEKNKRRDPSPISYVPQRETVDWDFPISVYDVVMMGRYGHIGLFGRPSTEDKAKVQAALAEVGMEQLADRQLSQLSGGQQQRVFLARAIAQDAPICLMDEPLTGLDAPNTAYLFKSLRNMVTAGKTVIVVHHYLDTLQHFDWLLLLNKHLIAAGPLQEVLTAENLEKTYGPQLASLQKIHNLLEKKKLPLTEEP